MKKILVFAIVTLFSISVFAQPVFDYNGIYYKPTSSTTVSVIANPNGTKYSGDITIPYTVKRGTIDFTVTSIADSAFYYCKELTSIDLPTSIAVIGKESFCGCRLLKSIELPNITNVPYCAFWECLALESVDISNVTTIDGYAFYRCVSLKSINIPNVITIRGVAFHSCAFDTIDLPKVETIGVNAFYSCGNLKSINMPKVKTLGGWAFGYCAFDTIDLPKVETIGINAFHSCENLKSINMPKVKTLEEGALTKCDFTSLNLPATLDSIGKCALTNLGLKYITIDEANENFAVRDNVLYDKDFTKLIQYPIGQEAKSISVSNTVTTLGGGAFAQCKSVERVDMPNVEIIEREAFSNCIYLKSVNMPKVTTIGPNAFIECLWVDSIDIPNVTILESYIFGGCENLKSINIPNVTILGMLTFYECKNLNSINIPNATKIGYSAFGYCSDLQKVVLGNKVDTIASDAFSYCRSLDTFRITAATPPVLGVDVFKDTPSDMLIQVPCGASSLYERVEVWKDFKNYEDWVPVVTVMSNDEKMGLVILDRQATCENPTAEIEAMPRSGYEFVKWSDENTENPRVVAVEDKDITLTAIFQKVGTDVENVGIEGVTIYSDGTVLHVEGAEKEYQIYSTTGSLLYRGTDAEVALPRGIYVVRYGNAIEKVVL